MKLWEKLDALQGISAVIGLITCYLEITNFVSIQDKKANPNKINEIVENHVAVIYTKSKKHEPYLQLKKQFCCKKGSNVRRNAFV